MASARVAYPSAPTVNAALNWSLAALRVAPSPATRVLHNPTAAALIGSAPPAAVTRPAAASGVRVFAAPAAAAAATPDAVPAAAAVPSAVQWVRLLSAVAARLERSPTLYVVDGDVGGSVGVRVLTASAAAAAGARLALGRLPGRAPVPSAVVMVAGGGLPGEAASVARRYGVAAGAGPYVAVYDEAGIVGVGGAEDEEGGGRVPSAAAVREGIAAVVAPSFTSGVLLRSALTPTTLLVGAAAASAPSTYGVGHHVLSATALSRAWAVGVVPAGGDSAPPPAAADVLTGTGTRLTRGDAAPRSVAVPPVLTLLLGGGGGAPPPKGDAAAAAPKGAKPVPSEAAAAFYFLAAGASPAAGAADRVAAAWAFGRAAAAAGADLLVAGGGGKAAGAELADRVAAEVDGTGVSVKGDELVDDAPAA